MNTRMPWIAGLVAFAAIAVTVLADSSGKSESRRAICPTASFSIPKMRRAGRCSAPASEATTPKANSIRSIRVSSASPRSSRTHCVRLRETGRYADGTMLLLTFYRPQSKSVPPLRGFVQGEILQREIHVIDRKRFPEEGRAFFNFAGTTAQSGSRVPLGSECVKCHVQHGQLDATFAQFYPPPAQSHEVGFRRKAP